MLFEVDQRSIDDLMGLQLTRLSLTTALSMPDVTWVKETVLNTALCCG